MAKKVARMRIKEMIEASRQSVGRNGSNDRASAKRFRTSMGLLAILSLLRLALIPCALPVYAGYESMWAGEVTQPVPEGAKVTLEFDRADYFLGENVLVHFVLQNTGDTPFEASWGGDYRGASRRLRFTVTATDEAG